jgi:hypothetical protein
MRNVTIDTQAIKAATDLLALAGRYTRLTRWSAHEQAGPCPRCGGVDRFHVHQGDGRAWWKCYRCQDHPSDCIALVMWADGVDFAEACRRLDPPAAPLACRAAAGLPDRPPARAALGYLAHAGPSGHSDLPPSAN